jgi:hypothetical protein
MPKAYDVPLTDIKVGLNFSCLRVCQDGYTLSNTPVPGFDNSEVISRVNAVQPLTSTDGSYHSEILRSVFNIGLKTTEAKPVWITPNSIRVRSFPQHGKRTKADPLDCTLHRQFARLINHEPKYLVKFANRYGLLRCHAAHKIVFTNPSTGEQAQIGESVLWWQEEIIDLANCVKLWDMVLSADKELRYVVLWHRDGIALKLGDREIQLVNRSNMNLMGEWTRGDLERPALYYLLLELDRRLTNSLTPRISNLDDKEIYFYPDSLLSAMWLMFLLEVNGSNKLLQCGVCGEYFNTLDPRAQFCSARCRMRKYRKHSSQKLRAGQVTKK